MYSIAVFMRPDFVDFKDNHAVLARKFWCKLLLYHNLQVVQDAFCVVCLIDRVLKPYSTIPREHFSELASQLVVVYIVAYQ